MPFNKTISTTINVKVATDTSRYVISSLKKGKALTDNSFQQRDVVIDATPLDLGQVTDFLHIDCENTVELLVKDTAPDIEQTITVDTLFLNYGSMFNVRVQSSIAGGVSARIIWS